MRADHRFPFRDTPMYREAWYPPPPLSPPPSPAPPAPAEDAVPCPKLLALLPLGRGRDVCPAAADIRPSTPSSVKSQGEQHQVRQMVHLCLAPFLSLSCVPRCHRDGDRDNQVVRLSFIQRPTTAENWSWQGIGSTGTLPLHPPSSSTFARLPPSLGFILPSRTGSSTAASCSPSSHEQPFGKFMLSSPGVQQRLDLSQMKENERKDRKV